MLGAGACVCLRPECQNSIAAAAQRFIPAESFPTDSSRLQPALHSPHRLLVHSSLPVFVYNVVAVSSLFHLFCCAVRGNREEDNCRPPFSVLFAGESGQNCIQFHRIPQILLPDSLSIPLHPVITVITSSNALFSPLVARRKRRARVTRSGDGHLVLPLRRTHLPLVLNSWSLNIPAGGRRLFSNSSP